MNKISIAIIDDESLVRLGIKSSVEWAVSYTHLDVYKRQA